MGRYVVRMQIKVIYNGVISVHSSRSGSVDLATPRNNGGRGRGGDPIYRAAQDRAGLREYPVFIRSVSTKPVQGSPGTCAR